MKNQEMLHIEWSGEESATYYIDQDQYSKASRTTPTNIILSAYEGTYTFDETTGEVKLFTGTETRTIKVKRWKTFSESRQGFTSNKK